MDDRPKRRFGIAVRLALTGFDQGERAVADRPELLPDDLLRQAIQDRRLQRVRYPRRKFENPIGHELASNATVRVLG